MVFKGNKKLIIFIMLVLFFSGVQEGFSAHGEGNSWVENPNLAGCEHCHDTVIEWDTGEMRQITDRDESVATTGGRAAQYHLINQDVIQPDPALLVIPPPCDTCDPNAVVPGLWNPVIDFMTEKEPTPLPYNELNVKTFLYNCYDNVSGSAYVGCPVGPGTMDDNCNCGPQTTTTTSTTSTSTSSTSTTSTTTDGSPPRPCDLRCQIRLSIIRPTVVRPPRPTIVRPSGTVTRTPTTITSTTSTTVVP